MKNNIIYRHIKPNGEVFYIGIGKTRQRAYSKQSRNPLWHNIVNKYGYEVQILKEGLSWEEATELECLLIDYYGRRDLDLGSLVNMTDGGEGALGRKYSEEVKDKISKTKTGKKHSEEHKKKIGDAHRGRKLSEEHKLKVAEAKKGKKLYNTKKVINTETGVTYNSITEAAEKENIKDWTLRYMLKGRSRNKTNLRLINI